MLRLPPGFGYVMSAGVGGGWIDPGIWTFKQKNVMVSPIFFLPPTPSHLNLLIAMKRCLSLSYILILTAHLLISATLFLTLIRVAGIFVAAIDEFPA